MTFVAKCSILFGGSVEMRYNIGSAEDMTMCRICQSWFLQAGL